MFGQDKAAALVRLDRDYAENEGRFALALAEHMAKWSRVPDIYAAVMDLGADIAPDAPLDAHGPSPVGPDVQVHSALSDARVRLLWQIECFPKPFVALIDRPITDREVGLTGFMTHRVAGDSYRLQFVAPGGDWLPAAGVGHVLARIPNGRGLEWALSGRAVGRGEALAAGLVTTCVSQAAFGAIHDGLALGHPVDPLLDGLHEPLAMEAGAPADDALRRCFTHGTVAEIIAALERERGAGEEWARLAIVSLRRWPVARADAVIELFARLAKASRRDSLILTARLAQAWRSPDFDCDRLLSAEQLKQIFGVRENGDLTLGTHQEIYVG